MLEVHDLLTSAVILVKVGSNDGKAPMLQGLSAIALIMLCNADKAGKPINAGNAATYISR